MRALYLREDTENAREPGSLVGEYLCSEEREREMERDGERYSLSGENAENLPSRLYDGGEASAKRVAPWENGSLIRKHRRSWHALTASKLKYISTTLGGRRSVYAR